MIIYICYHHQVALTTRNSLRLSISLPFSASIPIIYVCMSLLFANTGASSTGIHFENVAYEFVLVSLCLVRLTLMCNDLWQIRQSGISGTGCSSGINRKTAYVGWQAEVDHVNHRPEELVAVMKLFIYRYPRRDAVSYGSHRRSVRPTTKTRLKSPWTPPGGQWHTAVTGWESHAKEVRTQGPEYGITTCVKNGSI